MLFIFYVTFDTMNKQNICQIKAIPYYYNIDLRCYFIHVSLYATIHTCPPPPPLECIARREEI